ncbi:hypothetical protein EVAR_27481_1 [Eumeta japonica]|uniref:Uncharacterized protein n=1 Tax=Eumeta variegata TaxID=151549 RepID=A0A4C1XGM1_EUMVA|nr:hypothetical protein EVAR_27481_1 [Eumeta japonica]
MNTRNLRGVTSALPSSWVGIEYLLERGLTDKDRNDRGEVATGTLTHWTKEKILSTERTCEAIDEPRPRDHHHYHTPVLADYTAFFLFLRVNRKYDKNGT